MSLPKGPVSRWHAAQDNFAVPACTRWLNGTGCNIPSSPLRSGKSKNDRAQYPRTPSAFQKSLGYTLGSVDGTEARTRRSLPLFSPHPNLAAAVNNNLVQSEIEGGVHLAQLHEGTELEIRTENRRYSLIYRGRGRALLCGHPRFCPEPVMVRIHGSTWGGSMLKTEFIGRGMRMEFRHPDHQTVLTSRILEIWERPAPVDASAPASVQA